MNDKRHSGDDQLRPQFDENRARVDVRAFKAGLAERLDSLSIKRPHRAQRWVAPTVAAAVVLAAMAFGVYELVDRLPSGDQVLIFTDDALAESTTTPAAAATVSAATTTTFPAPLPESAWPYPDYTPDPERVPSEQVRGLAELVVARFSLLQLQVKSAVELRFEDKTILDFSLSIPGANGASVTVTIFGSDEQSGETDVTDNSLVGVPGAKRAYLTTQTLPSGKGLVSHHLLATMPDNVVINAYSTALEPEDAPPPLDRDQLVEMVSYLVSVIANGETPLPDLSIAPTTTVPWAYLPQGMTQPCFSTVGNAVCYVANGQRTDFIRLLIPGAQKSGDAAYQAERERMKASGMSANEYSNPRDLVIVQWKDGAYLTDLGYFEQTRPPVPAEVGAWLEEDPALRAAAGMTMADKTVRWFLLEGQPDGAWLLRP